MPFYAKPDYGYSINSDAGRNNIVEITRYLTTNGYSKDSITGIIGNIYEESGLNPWYWENHLVNYNNGYGLFQFTPALQYINATGIPNHAPNLSTSQQTAGASPEDAKGQLYCFVSDTFDKWYPTLWRTYWDPSEYPTLYTQAQNILTTYGNGSSLTMAQFKAIDNYADAVLAFLGCYEGPTVPDYSERLAAATLAKPIVDSYEGYFDILFLKKFIDNQRKPLV